MKKLWLILGLLIVGSSTLADRSAAMTMTTFAEQVKIKVLVLYPDYVPVTEKRARPHGPVDRAIVNIGTQSGHTNEFGEVFFTVERGARIDATAFKSLGLNVGIFSGTGSLPAAEEGAILVIDIHRVGGFSHY